MKSYLVSVTKLGSVVKHPDVGHKDYQNAGYNPDMTECIWVAEDDVNMNVDGVEEIPFEEAEELLEKWGEEKAALKEEE